MHVYKREFSVSNGLALGMPAGESALCFAIEFPQEGKITRLIVAQASGDALAVDYTVDLYDRAVCEVASHGDDDYSASSVSGNTQDDAMTATIAKIIPTQNAAAGEAMELRNGDGYTYRNREGTFTVPVRKVYLGLTVEDTTNDSNWEVAIECEYGNELN